MRKKLRLMSGEDLGAQIKRLADFIFENIPREPLREEKTVDTAIRIIRKYINLKEQEEVENSTWKY